MGKMPGIVEQVMPEAWQSFMSLRKVSVWKKPLERWSAPNSGLKSAKQSPELGLVLCVNAPACLQVVCESLIQSSQMSHTNIWLGTLKKGFFKRKKDMENENDRLIRAVRKANLNGKSSRIKAPLDIFPSLLWHWRAFREIYLKTVANKNLWRNSQEANWVPDLCLVSFLSYGFQLLCVTPVPSRFHRNYRAEHFNRRHCQACWCRLSNSSRKEEWNLLLQCQLFYASTPVREVGFCGEIRIPTLLECNNEFSWWLSVLLGWLCVDVPTVGLCWRWGQATQSSKLKRVWQEPLGILFA